MATPKTLTTEETEKLLEQLLGTKTGKGSTPKEIRNYTIALLMLDAGLRVGEVVQLQISDLYFNSLPVTSIIIRPDIAKNRNERIIPISQRLSDALKKYFQDFTPIYHSDYERFAFFSASHSHPITTRQIERIIRSTAEKSLGRPVHPHVLRHTFASRLMRTTNSRVVQELLGHKNLSSTQIYTHPNNEDLKKAIESLEIVPPKVLLKALDSAIATNAADRLDTPDTDRDMR